MGQEEDLTWVADTSDSSVKKKEKTHKENGSIKTEEPAMKKKLFISYSHEDSSKVKKFAFLLSMHGFDLWMDEKNVMGGDNYTTRILSGIHDSDIYLVFLSQASMKSSWVAAEIDFALREKIERGKLSIIPILLEDVNIPISLSNIDCLDARYSIHEVAERLSQQYHSEKIEHDDIAVSSVSFSISEDTSVQIGPFNESMTIEDLKEDRIRVISDLRKRAYGILMNFVSASDFDFQSETPKFTNGLYEEKVEKKEEVLRAASVNALLLKQLFIIHP